MTSHLRLGPGALVFEPPPLCGEINESNQAWKRLSIPQTVCSRTTTAHRHLQDRFMVRRKMEGGDRIIPQRKNWNIAATFKCQASHCGNKYWRCTHLWASYNIFNYDAMTICISLSPYNIILWLTTYEGCVRRLYVIREDLFKASVEAIWISEP